MSIHLPITTNGDRVVTLGELADIRLTFQDRTGTARFNGETTIALQVVKRQGFNVMDTADLVRADGRGGPRNLAAGAARGVRVDTTLDQSVQVDGMVRQLEGSVLTAIALVMIVVLAALGTRSAMLVGFAIPTSFLLCFILLGVMGIPISNIVMFGLILAVGMLVDGAIVVVEYADKRLSEGARPMQAYTDAAKRMFWPVVSSTATTLCAFLPMLFWPGVAGRIHGHAARDADLRSVGLADRGADLPAGPGRRRGALFAQCRPRVAVLRGWCRGTPCASCWRRALPS
jgi:multidrug efflux pump